MPCGATQEGWVMVERSDRMWSTGEGNGKPLQYSYLENPTNSMKRQNDRILKEELPRSAGAQYATGEDGWMTSPTRWTWVWVNSGSWWWTGRPGVLQFVGSQRVRHDWATELIIFIIENHVRISGPTQSKLLLLMGQLSLTSVWTLAYKVPGFTSHVRFTSHYIQAVEAQITRSPSFLGCALTATPAIS